MNDHIVDLILLRHGQAERMAVTGHDVDRPLTGQGAEDVKLVASRFATSIPATSVVISSPYLRTQQTALIVADVLDQPVHIDERLGANRSAPAMVDVIRDFGTDSLIVVGHLPTLALVAAQLLQLPSVCIDIPPGTAVGLRWVSRQRMLVDLVWMIPPYLFRS